MFLFFIVFLSVIRTDQDCRQTANQPKEVLVPVRPRRQFRLLGYLLKRLRWPDHLCLIRRSTRHHLLSRAESGVVAVGSRIHRLLLPALHRPLWAIIHSFRTSVRLSSVQVLQDPALRPWMDTDPSTKMHRDMESHRVLSNSNSGQPMRTLWRHHPFRLQFYPPCRRRLEVLLHHHLFSLARLSLSTLLSQ